MLQSIGDALKVDAIHHQSRIDDEEIEYLLTLTEESAGRFVDLKGGSTSVIIIIIIIVYCRPV